tara:strand:+ start:1205 stop:1795 length:591 start_codon:yes stop_codon:yes gene_type:complete
MLNTYFKIPNLNIDKKEIEAAARITQYHFSGEDNFKAKIYSEDIPIECKKLIELRDTGVMHDIFTIIHYSEDKLTLAGNKFFTKIDGEYVVGKHKDGNDTRYAGSLVFPLYNADNSIVEWYADHPNQKEFNVKTGTWCENEELLEKVCEVSMVNEKPIILRTDAWHGIRFKTVPRVIMRWLFRHDLTWNDISKLFD